LGLAWLLGRQAGGDAMAAGLAAALLLGLALWWVGARQRAGRSATWWPLLPALLAAAAIVVALPIAAPVPAHGEKAPGDAPYSAARLAALRGQERPVFVYLTADWCLTCKVNEAAAIDRAETR